MYFDELLRDHVGELGKFQLLVIFVLTFEQFIGTFHTMSSVFTAAVPKHWCRHPDMDLLRNLTRDVQLALTVPPGDAGKCHHYERNLSELLRSADGMYRLTEEINATSGQTIAENETLVECRSWIYDDSVYQRTMVTEWNLVCDNAWKSKTISSSFLVGMMVGGFTICWLGDRYGRIRVTLIVGAPLVCVGTLSAFVYNYYLFLVLRFCEGFFASGKTTLGFIIAMEYTGPSKRVYVCSYYYIVWALGYMGLGCLAYLVRDWRTLQLIISVPEIIYYVMLYFLIPESPRWLFLTNRTEKAVQVVRKMAKMNNTKLPVDVQVFGDSKSDQKHSPLDLFNTPQMRFVTLILFVLWAANGFTYYGISLNSSALYGNPYVNFAISGAVEIPAYLFIMASFSLMGRIIPLTGSMVLAGLPLLLVLAVPADHSIVSTVLVMISKFFITATFSMAYIYTGEVYPTSIRSIGMATGNMASKITAPIAPYATLLDVIHPSISTIMYGSVAILAGLLMIWMPETNNKALLQTVEESERALKQYRLACCIKPDGAQSTTTSNGLVMEASSTLEDEKSYLARKYAGDDGDDRSALNTDV